MIKYIFLLLAITASHLASAWDGEDEEGYSVYIGSGNLVRPGSDIEYEVDGDEVSATVESVTDMGHYVEVEVTDEDGESHTLEMESR